MSWSIGLHLGDHLVDIVAKNLEDRSTVKRRFFFPHTNAEAALGLVLQELNLNAISRLMLMTDLPIRLALKCYGGESAVLITSGFENWLEMTSPIKTPNFSSTAQRFPMPIERELFFGVTERVNAHGEIEKSVDPDDLEFLAAKLQLNQIKNVAVCLLHSTLNNQNERAIKEYLEPKGFRVHLSSAVSTPEAVGFAVDEKERFWTAILSAYVFEMFANRIKKIQAIFEPILESNAVITFGHYPLSDLWNGQVPLLQTANLFYEQLAKNIAGNGPVFYAGTDFFALLHGGGRRQTSWNSPWGPVALSAPAHATTRIRPLTSLAKNFISPIGFSSEYGTYDQGPMIFGRSQVPTFFDLMALNINPKDECIARKIAEPTIERGRRNLIEQLSAYKRSFTDVHSLTGEELGARLFELGCEILRDEIHAHLLDANAAAKLQICGPLAATLAKPLRGRLVDPALEPPCID